jgi:hypothetical protein
MDRHWQYLKYVLRHKWFVFWECIRIGGVPIVTALIHDWDKFLPDEWFPYVNFFHGKKTEEAKAAFDVACELHYKRNQHHWNHWLGKDKCIPDVYIREMVADWRGAGRAITGKDDTLNWYIDNYYTIQLDTCSRLRVERLLLGEDVGLMTMGTEAQMENCSVQDWRWFWHFLADTSLADRRAGKVSYEGWMYHDR